MNLALGLLLQVYPHIDSSTRFPSPFKLIHVRRGMQRVGNGQLLHEMGDICWQRRKPVPHLAKMPGLNTIASLTFLRKGRYWGWGWSPLLLNTALLHAWLGGRILVWLMECSLVQLRVGCLCVTAVRLSVTVNNSSSWFFPWKWFEGCVYCHY